MSLLEGCKSVTVREFNGARPAVDVVDVSPGDAILAYNAKFGPGRTYTREGFDFAFASNPTEHPRSLFYYAQGQVAGDVTHYLARLDDTGIVLKNLTTLTECTLKSYANAIGSAAWFAPFGNRLYATPVAGGATPGTGFVWDGNAADTMDTCFQRPMTIPELTLTVSEPSTGDCTAGPHSVMVIFETRAGYWTKPGPAAVGLSSLPILTSSGGKNARVTLTPVTTWPSWIKAVQVLYTTTLNSFQYYVVPGTITAVTPGSATVLNIDFSVSDLQLRSIGSVGAGTLADDYFGLLAMDTVTNAAPFTLKFMIPWGNRMVWFANYGGVDSFFPSDQLNAEWISADQHILQLPGGKPIGAAFVLNSLLYVISSAGGVFAYADNGGRPVTFDPPKTIDERISAVGPWCASVSSSGEYAMVAAVQGLFVYTGGAFPQIPLSYYQSTEWDTINWVTGVSGVVVKDSRQDNTIIVRAPQIGASPPAGSIVEMYAWNYVDGMTPKSVKYSRWTSLNFEGVRLYPNLEIVLNPTYKTWEVWCGCEGTGLGIMRQKSLRSGDAVATLYQDQAGPINFQYQPSLLPNDGSGNIYNHMAVRFRAKSLTSSTGTLALTVQNLDGTATITPAASPFTIAALPGKFYYAFYDMQNEMASYLFTNGTIANNGISVSEFVHYYNLFSEQR